MQTFFDFIKKIHKIQSPHLATISSFSEGVSGNPFRVGSVCVSRSLDGPGELTGAASPTPTPGICSGT